MCAHTHTPLSKIESGPVRVMRMGGGSESGRGEEGGVEWCHTPNSTASTSSHTHSHSHTHNREDDQIPS